MRSRIASATVLCLLIAFPRAHAQTDALPSWNDGPAKKAIVDFVRASTARDSPHFVPPEARIAAFDNDGTLWVEQPIYTQVTFAIDR
ncbi:MAG TPA: haloacid dehalogenase-like hydrolase, partial [Methylomirabilota bacterium]